MAETKSKKKNIVSPRGVAMYPKLITPDTKFKTEGEYSVKLRIPEAAATPLVEMLDEQMEASYEKAASDPKNKGKKIKRADPPYKQEESGEYVFHFKMTASGEYEGKKYTQRPVIADSKGTVIDPKVPLKIGSGTEMKVSFQLYPWWTALLGAGVSLRLKGAQILKLVEYSQDLGFTSEEADGGYTYSPEGDGEPASDFSPDAEAPATDENQDF